MTRICVDFKCMHIYNGQWHRVYYMVMTMTQSVYSVYKVV